MSLVVLSMVLVALCQLDWRSVVILGLAAVVWLNHSPGGCGLTVDVRLGQGAPAGAESVVVPRGNDHRDRLQNH